MNIFARRAIWRISVPVIPIHISCWRSAWRRNALHLRRKRMLLLAFWTISWGAVIAALRPVIARSSAIDLRLLLPTSRIALAIALLSPCAVSVHWCTGFNPGARAFHWRMRLYGPSMYGPRIWTNFRMNHALSTDCLCVNMHNFTGHRA